MGSIEVLRELCKIPSYHGEQFITVYLNVVDMQHGMIYFGFKHKIAMGEISFKNIDEAIAHVEELRKKARFGEE